MTGPDLPRRLRLAAYALVVDGGHVLLTRLAPFVVDTELWTLPGGGVEHGEDPRDAVVREVLEETGLAVEVSERVWVDSLHRADDVGPDGLRSDYHGVRLVYDGRVGPGRPTPHVVEVDGSTVDAAWHPVSDVLEGRLPVAALAATAVRDHGPARR